MNNFFDNLEGFDKAIIVVIALIALAITTGVSVDSFFDHCTAMEAMKHGYEQRICKTPSGYETLWIKVTSTNHLEAPQ